MANVRPLRAMCVDDNPDSADSLALLLGMLGFRAKACYSGREALAADVTFRPTVCFIDLGMPGMDGDILAKCLRANAHSPRFLIAVTGWSGPECDARIRAAGFDFQLEKPVTAETLSAVADLIDRMAE